MMSAQQILASSLMMGIILFIIGLTGAISIIEKYIPKAVIRGIQFSTGTLLIVQGVKMIIGNSAIQNLYQMAEPYLKVQSLSIIPIGLIIGIIGIFITLILLDNKKIPAGLIIVFLGLFIGLVFGKSEELSVIQLGFYLPQWMPFGFPAKIDFTFAVFALVLPQLPMTIGNAVVASADLSNKYFHEKSGKVTYKSLCISMAVGNFISFLVGGMPLCHGAGGLSAHYRFGARTAGSNLIIGFILIGLVIVLGDGIFLFLSLIPMAILGILLIFAGSQLAMTILDINGQKQMFVVVCILGVTLATNLAIGFGVGLVLAWLLKSNRLNV